MKESYLIPKITYERLLKGTTAQTSDTTMAKTTIPPTLTEESIIPLNIQELPTQKKKNHNPALYHLPLLTLAQSKAPYAYEILEYLKQSDQIQWDDEGNLFPPFDGLNVVDFIKILNDGRRYARDENSAKYELLIKMLNLPPSFIRNTKLREQMSGGGSRLPPQWKIKKGVRRSPNIWLHY